MRTVLFSSVAALALTLATGSLSPAHAQAPEAAPPADTQAAPDQTAPAKHVRHHVHHAAVTGDDRWAHEPGTGMSGPASVKASNIDAADTHSAIAPHLPQPKVGDGADAVTYLQAAQAALAAHKTGSAQQALEMAETRLLDRSTPVDTAGQPDADNQVAQVANARKALASGDTKGASSAIAMALSATNG